MTDGTLTLQIVGLRDGMAVLAALYDAAVPWRNQAIQRVQGVAQGESATLSFDDLAPGHYALVLEPDHHDPGDDLERTFTAFDFHGGERAIRLSAPLFGLR